MGEGAFQTVVQDLAEDDILDIDDQPYTGTVIEPEVEFCSRTFLGKEFVLDVSNYDKSYENNLEAGNAVAVFTDKDNSASRVEKSFAIVKSSTIFSGGVKTKNGQVEADTFSYGDTITVTAKPQASGQTSKARQITPPAASQMALFLGERQITPPAAGQMALFLGERQITPAVNAGADGIYTMEYHTVRQDLAIGVNHITARYAGNGNMADCAGDVTVTLNKKTVMVTADNQTVAYGEAVPALTMTVPDGALVEGDTAAELGVTLSTAAVRGSTVGTYEITGTASSTNYEVAVRKGTLSIAPAAIEIRASVSDADYTGMPYAGLEHPAADGYNGQFTVVYKESTIPLKGAPVNAGSYTVTVTPADPGFAGEWNGSFVIRRIPATVRAADASMTAGGPEPEYQLEVTGFVNGEMISDVSFDSSAVDRSTAGTYEVIPSGGTVSGGGMGNYNITYEKGYLTVIVDTPEISPLPPVDTPEISPSPSVDTPDISSSPSVDTANKGEVRIPAVVDQNGSAAIQITDQQVQDAIDRARGAARLNGTQTGGVTVVIHAVTSSQEADAVVVSLPRTVLEKLIAEKTDRVAVAADDLGVQFEMDLAAVMEIYRQAETDVKLTVTTYENSKLSGAAQAALENRPSRDRDFLCSSTGRAGRKRAGGLRG